MGRAVGISSAKDGRNFWTDGVVGIGVPELPFGGSIAPSLRRTSSYEFGIIATGMEDEVDGCERFDVLGLPESLFSKPLVV